MIRYVLILLAAALLPRGAAADNACLDAAYGTVDYRTAAINCSVSVQVAHGYYMMKNRAATTLQWSKEGAKYNKGYTKP